jgi:tetratricopeptide (TPR) repeat protein
MRKSGRSARCALAALVLAAAQAAAQDSPQQIFERALQERDRGDLYEAIRSFHAILDQNPGLARARLELAVAYYHALDHRAALEQARRVLADPATPPAVRANVERLIAQIEAEARPHRFGGFVSGGWLYDSNVTAGPPSPSFEVGGSFVGLDPAAVERSDGALAIALGASHRYLSGWRPGVGGREGALLWQSQALLNVLDYRHENAFDLRVLTLTTGPAWISPPRLRFHAPFQYDRLELGDAHYLDILSVSPTLVTGTPAGFELTVETYLQERSYRRAIDVGRDADYSYLGLQVGRVFSAMTVQAGVRRTRENADDPQWDYRGTELTGYVAGEPIARVSAYLRLTYSTYDYEGLDALTGASRSDTETRISLGASYRFATGPGEPWSTAVSLLDIRHRSDLSIYSFDRRQVSLTVTRSF